MGLEASPGQACPSSAPRRAGLRFGRRPRREHTAHHPSCLRLERSETPGGGSGPAAGLRPNRLSVVVAGSQAPPQPGRSGSDPGPAGGPTPASDARPARPTFPAEAPLLAAALREEAVEARVDVAGEDAGQGQSQADGLHRPHRQRRQQQQAQRRPAQLHTRTRAAPRVLALPQTRATARPRFRLRPDAAAIFVRGGSARAAAAAIFVWGRALACFWEVSAGGRWGRF